MTYFTSDLHFGHSNIMGFDPCFRQFRDTDEMDRRLISIWNSQVNYCDTVYDLGDLSFHKDMDKNLSILKRLNGKHILIMGNHDSFFRANKDELLSMKKDDGNALFDEICEYKDAAIQMDGEKRRVIMFHYPIIEWNAGHRGAIHLYGHLHSNMAPIRGKALNVGYDLHGKLLESSDVWRYVKDIEPFEHSTEWMFGLDDSIEARAKKIQQMLKRFNE